MRALIPALVALSLGTPALAAPDPGYELAAGSPLGPFQLAQTMLTIAPSPRLKDPWEAAHRTGGGTMVVAGLALGMAATGNSLVALGAELVAPLVLSTGYLYAEAPWWHAPLVVAGAYGVEILGAIVGGALGSSLGGSSGGINGLFVGPAVVLLGYGALAGRGAYEEALGYNRRQPKAQASEATP